MSSGTLGLKQATRDTKPIVVRMKRARPAKPTFSTKNIAERIDEGKEAGAAATAAAPYDSLLARWLRDGHGDRDGFFEAREYLLKGPPYKGSSRFDAKDTIKELGAKWVPNALKDKGDANDKRCYGWWSAVDEATLAALIRLPLDEKSRRRWTALSTPEHAHFGILRLLKEFEVFTKMEEDDVKRKHDAARALKSALVANRARNDVPGMNRSHRTPHFAAVHCNCVLNTAFHAHSTIPATLLTLCAFVVFCASITSGQHARRDSIFMERISSAHGRARAFKCEPRGSLWSTLGAFLGSSPRACLTL